MGSFPGGWIIRILIVDDHDVVRVGLRQLLADMDGWELCGEAVDGLQAVVAATQLKPNVIVMDVSMPNMSGVEAARAILDIDKTIKIVLISMHDPVQVADAARRAGASVQACLSKQSVAADLKSVLASFATKT
jgi:DNA-binding NarL/FixJ family response regulator